MEQDVAADPDRRREVDGGDPPVEGGRVLTGFEHVPQAMTLDEPDEPLEPGGVPVEEFIVPVILGTSAFCAGVRALIAHRRTRERSPS